MALTTIAVLGLALALDLLVGEPPNRLHPVAWFGRLVDAADRDWGGTEHRQRRMGVALAFVLPLVPAAVAGIAVLVTTAVSPILGAIAAALALFVTISLRLLLELTGSVLEATETDLERAREELLGLAGRDASSLSPARIRSAAIESAAENLSDGFVASLLPFAVLAPVSLPLAVAAAAWVKGVNTLDSMLGYRSKPIGTASARLDDLVMWIPARVTALCLAVAAADPGALGRARSWARVPSSPNSGWPMATLACVLSVRLEKPGAYVLNDRSTIDDGSTADDCSAVDDWSAIDDGSVIDDGSGTDLPTAADGQRAISVVGLAAGIAVVLALALAMAGAVTSGEIETIRSPAEAELEAITFPR